MTDLSEFLLARIGEDEQQTVRSWPFSNAKIAADCEAKRRIVAWHRLIDGLDTEDNPVRGCGSCIASGMEPPYIIAGPCMTLRLLALPYADHADYDQEWRP